MRQTALLGSILLFSAAAHAANPTLLNLVMPDAKVLAGVNVAQAKASAFGSFVISQMMSNQQGFQDFVTATGFDPTRDVTEILAASTGDKSNPDGVILASGTFDSASIAAAAVKDGKHQSQTYAGATLVTSSDPKMDDAVAFVDGTIAVAGKVAAVKAALDRRSGKNSIDSTLAGQVDTLSKTEDAWSISVASLASLFPSGANNNQPPQLALLQNIVQSSGGVKFGDQVQVTGHAVTTSDRNATALSDVITFVAQLVAANASKGSQASDAATLLKNLTVTTDGANVNIALVIAEADLENLIKSGQAARNRVAPAIRR